MRIVNVLLLFLVVLEYVIAQDYDQDWPNLNRYKNENAKLCKPIFSDKTLI